MKSAGTWCSWGQVVHVQFTLSLSLIEELTCVQFPPRAIAIHSFCIAQDRGDVAEGVMTPVRARQLSLSLVCVSAAGSLHEPQSQISA